MSLRDQEGYLLLDHRNSPGIPEKVAVTAGLPVGAGKGVFESATYTCKHCQLVGVKNPSVKNGGIFCRGCQHLICDHCAAERVRTGLCRTFDQVIDEILAKANR